MNKEKSMFLRSDFWKVTALCFGPILLPVVGFAVMEGPLLFSLWSRLIRGEKTVLPTEQIVGETVFIALQLAALFFFSAVCYRFYARASAWLTKGLTVYAFWNLSVFVALMPFLLMVGGASMAVVDGGATRGSLYWGAAFKTVELMLLGQAFVIPWVCFSIGIMKMGKNKKANDQKNP